jgi:FHA domain-containing protein
VSEESSDRALAFLVYDDESAFRRTFRLDAGTERVRIGRGEGTELRLGWDREVSRVHAELEPLGDTWAVVDDGLSSNGTFVNEERVRGRRRLSSGDRIRVGSTTLVFRALSERGSLTFIPALGGPPVDLSRMQQHVLIALCRPFRDGPTHAAPAANQQIADELHLTVGAVKAHLRALFTKLAITDLSQNRKRAMLVDLAFERGLVSEHDLTA